MAGGSMARLVYLAREGVWALPTLVRHPQLVPLIRKGVHPATVMELAAPWLKAAGIRTILDIGANVGQFALAARMVFPQATIYSFEPLPDCYEQLVRNTRHLSHARAFNVALGDECGRVTMYRNAFTPASSLLRTAEVHNESFPWVGASTPIEVELRCLDDALARVTVTSPLLIKIDVQGYEERVLRGATETLKAADYVIVETAFIPLYEGLATFESVYALMLDRGFRYCGNLGQLHRPADGAILQADAIFRRR